MKFPTSEPLFATLSLTPDECRRYTLLAKAIVQDTVADYDQYVHEHQRQVSKQRWKGVKSRENISVYKARDHNPQDNIHRGLASGLAINMDAPLDMSSIDGHFAGNRRQKPATITPALLENFPAQEYNLPKLLMVGTISGTLDDVVYGLSTHDSSSILLKAAYTQDEIVDGQILYQFEGPSPAKPYKFLGIKWVVKGNPLAVSAVVAPRDLLFLNAIGIMNRGGERLGYILIHSIDLPNDVPSLQHKHRIIRGRLSTCYIFKQLRDDCVEVYMKGYIEPSGKLVESVAINSAVTGLLFCWKAVVCSQAKKIVWMMSQKPTSSSRSTGKQIARSTSSNHLLACVLCRRNLKVFNSSVECEMCDLSMCSRCRVSMKLCFETVGSKHIEQRSVTLCKSCITRAHQMDTLQVAQDEVRSGRFGLSFSSSESRSSSWDPSSKVSSTSTGGGGASAWGKLARAVSNAETVRTLPESGGESFGGESAYTSNKGIVVELGLDDDLYTRKNSRTGSSGDDGAAEVHPQPMSAGQSITGDSEYQGWSSEKQEMWERMTQLKVQVDDVYQIAQKNRRAAGLTGASEGVEGQSPPPPTKVSATSSSRVPGSREHRLRFGAIEGSKA